MSQSMTLSGGSRLRLVKVAAAGILAVSGISGLLLNRSSADVRLKALQEDPTLALPEALPPQAEPVLAVGGGDQRVLFSLRTVQTEVPPDPFQPVAMKRPIPRSPLAQEALRIEEAPRVVEAPAPRPQPARVEPAAPAAPAVKVEDLVLTGVVHGDPPLAVVQFEGQSLFLKIGEQVADSWRLVEVKERSAIFQMGARRVEVPIKGGSSE